MKSKTPLFTDQHHLRKDQYRDSSNLASRISLHGSFSVNPIPWQEWVFSQIDLPDEAEILELGCGSGNLWTENKPLDGEIWSLLLTDLSLGMVRETIGSVQQWRHVLGAVADAANLPLCDDRFDAVISNHVLFHVKNPAQALSEIHRVLRTGGILYATTVGREHLLELREVLLLAKDIRADVMDDESAQVLAGFTLQSGVEKAQDQFREVEVRVFDDWLEITDVEPLIEYVLSSSVWDLKEEGICKLRDIVEKRIKNARSFRVRKHQGMIIARK